MLKVINPEYETMGKSAGNNLSKEILGSQLP
jgi:hypothetical protein